jgi:hypothetical protein
VIAARSQQAIPLAAADELTSLARRTAVARYVLAAALLAAIAVAVSLGRDPEKRAGSLFPGSDSGMLVLDISASIGAPGRTFLEPLEYLSRTGQDFGLVFFSDVGYEAVPPGTSSDELRQFIRVFEKPIQPCAVPPGRPCPAETRRMTKAEAAQARRLARRPDPWSTSFRGGTRISTGLRVGREVLEREGLTERGVLLVSDLGDSSFDLPALTREVIRYKDERIPLHVVAVNADRSDKDVFDRLLASSAFVSRGDLSLREARTKAARTAAAFPIDLATVGVLAVLLLALNEYFCGRLSWGRLGGRRDEVRA